MATARRPNIRQGHNAELRCGPIGRLARDPSTRQRGPDCRRIQPARPANIANANLGRIAGEWHRPGAHDPAWRPPSHDRHGAQRQPRGPGTRSSHTAAQTGRRHLSALAADERRPGLNRRQGAVAPTRPTNPAPPPTAAVAPTRPTNPAPRRQQPVAPTRPTNQLHHRQQPWHQPDPLNQVPPRRRQPWHQPDPQTQPHRQQQPWHQPNPEWRRAQTAGGARRQPQFCLVLKMRVSPSAWPKVAAGVMVANADGLSWKRGARALLGADDGVVETIGLEELARGGLVGRLIDGRDRQLARLDVIAATTPTRSSRADAAAGHRRGGVQLVVVGEERRARRSLVDDPVRRLALRRVAETR